MLSIIELTCRDFFPPGFFSVFFPLSGGGALLSTQNENVVPFVGPPAVFFVSVSNVL